MTERLQKLIAQANIASRRAAETLIREGRVQVNGKIAGLGDKADPATDTITVDGERLKFTTTRRYIAYNKPVNVLSAPAHDHDDERQTVRAMIPVEGHLFTIGRLDAESDGLIILTDDGEMANRLMHPRYEHTKTYKVIVYGSPTEETLDKWEHGVFLEEGRTAPCSIRVQERDGETTALRIVMIEGKNRQIRRIAALLGHPVKRLTRTHIGMFQLGTLRRGEWRQMTPDEIEMMQAPAPDLSYIRKLRRELRGLRATYYSRQRDTVVETPRAPARGSAKPRTAITSIPVSRPAPKSRPGRKPRPELTPGAARKSVPAFSSEEADYEHAPQPKGRATPRPRPARDDGDSKRERPSRPAGRPGRKPGSAQRQPARDDSDNKRERPQPKGKPAPKPRPASGKRPTGGKRPSSGRTPGANRGKRRDG